MNRNIEAGSVWFYTGESKTKVMALKLLEDAPEQCNHCDNAITCSRQVWASVLIDIGTSGFCILQTITCCIGNSDWYKREPIEEGGKDE
jgi:hypothetical protein